MKKFHKVSEFRHDTSSLESYRMAQKIFSHLQDEFKQLFSNPALRVKTSR